MNRLASSSKLLTISLVILAVCASSAFAKESPGDKELLGFGGVLFMPDVKPFEARNEYVIGVKVHVDCLGIDGVSDLPDGWEITSKVHGESVDLALKLEERWLGNSGDDQLKNMQDGVSKIRISLLSRGQWSDCMGWRMELDTVSKSDKAKALKTYRFKDCSSIDYHTENKHQWCLMPDEKKA